MAQLEIQNLSRHFEGVHAVDHVSFDVNDGEFVSIIGPNGAGKTTLFNLITGLDKPTTGTIRFDGHLLNNLHADQFAQFGIARTFQHGRVFGNLSVLENVLIGAHTRRQEVHAPSLLGMFLESFNGLVTPPAARREEARLKTKAQEILALFGERLTPRVNDPAYTLSYANRRRLEIARALALKPRLLLLDEPTAGMNPAETAEMLEFLRTLRTGNLTILLIEHKLSLVMQLSQRVIVMDNGIKIADGAPDVIQNDPRVVEAYLGNARANKFAATKTQNVPTHIAPESAKADLV